MEVGADGMLTLLRFGSPLLLEVSDKTVDLFLDPVLMKQTFIHEEIVSVSIRIILLLLFLLSMFSLFLFLFFF